MFNILFWRGLKPIDFTHIRQDHFQQLHEDKAWKESSAL